MRLSRTDLVPLLAIVAGGVMGASLSLRLVSSDDVPAPDPVVAPSAPTDDLDPTITQLRTIQIFVTGEVAQPGAYILPSVATVRNALYAAGGPTELGNPFEIKVERRSGDEISLDLYSYLLEGDVPGDVRLEQGDVVFVPPR